MSTKEHITDVVISTKEVSEHLKEALTNAKGGKVEVGTVVRLIAMIVSWLNQILVMCGIETIPVASENINYLIATGITIAVTAYSYWKNNSWSTSAITSDAIMNMMKETGVTQEELIDAVSSTIDSINHTKKENKK